MSRPTHYRTIAVSLYTADIELADKLVAEMKAHRIPHATRSELIRLALRQFDISKVQR